MTSETSFRYAFRVTTVMLEHCSNRYACDVCQDFCHKRNSRCYGGLVLVRSRCCPCVCQDFCHITPAAVSNVTRYLVTGVSPITPALRGVTLLLHPQPPHTGASNTDAHNALSGASKSLAYVNTLAQRLERA